MSDVSQRARRRIAVRLLPFVLAMYVVCYVDRVNVAFANLRMSADLGFSDPVYGLGVGMFFVGYILFEVPGAIIVERWSARKWMARIMISWGLITILTRFIHTPRQFYIFRWLVGVSEASFFPGIIVYLTHWFRHSDRAKAIGFFYIGVPGAQVAGSLIAGWLLGVNWLGIAGWRWLFILEGIPPIILGAVALFYLTDWPRQARWLLMRPAERLTDEERLYRAALLESDEDVKVAYTMAEEFGELVRARDRQELGPWLGRAVASTLAEFRQFALVLQRDLAAVEAALTYEWSNGQTEGQITKLKLLKRQMFGRASFDLLKKRELKAA